MISPLAMGLVMTLASTEHDPDVERQARAAIERAAGFDREWLPSAERQPVEIKVNDEGRVSRFVGAFVGGLVGAAATMAFLPLVDAGGVFRSVTPAEGALGLFTPLAVMLGAFAGYQVMGGDGGLVAPAMMIIPAALVMMLLLSALPAQVDTLPTLMPAVLASVGLLAAASAFALDFRQGQLDALGARRAEGSARVGRVAAEVLVNVLALAATGALFAAALGISSGSTVGGVVAISLGVLGGAGAAAATWGVHLSLGGKGTYLAALLGLLAGAGSGLLVALLAGPATAFAPLRGSVAVLYAVEAPVLAAVMASSVALEWSHTSAVGEEDGPRFSVGGAPTVGGAMVTAGVRF